MRHIWLSLLAALVGTGTSAAETEDQTPQPPLPTIDIEGTVGTYFEYRERDLRDADSGWGTGYLELKLGASPWERVRLGATLFAHEQLFSEAGDGSDPYEADVEKDVGLPELYLALALAENASLTLGRFRHGAVSHLDDTQSEGAVLQWDVRENTRLLLGAMRKFAEWDYDDGEDFGRHDGSQSLHNEDAYGEETSGFVAFAELRLSALDGALALNPYTCVHDGYAAVYGADVDVEVQTERVTLGTRIDGYAVDPSGDTDTDGSFNWAVAPFLHVAPFTVTVGYARFGGDSDHPAMNKPRWLKDYLVEVLDQDMPYANQDCSVVFGKLAFEHGSLWAHVSAGNYRYDRTATRGTASQELEFQVGYAFTEAFDANIRAFDVDHVDVADRDYRKVEARVRYQF